MRIYVGQLNPIVGDLEGNTDKVLETMEKARAEKADLVVFPEMTLCGYMPEDLVLHGSFIRAMEDELDRVVRASKGLSVICGVIRQNPFHEEKNLLNSAAIIEDGQLMGFHNKWLLPTYDVFDERRYFARGKVLRAWHIAGVKVGVLICEDMWQNAGESISGTTYPWDPVKALAIYKPQIVVNLTASPFQAKKKYVRVEVCKAAVRTLNCPVLYVCQVGANGPIVFDGYSLYVDVKEELRFVAAGFREDFFLLDTEKEPPAVRFENDPIDEMISAIVLGIRDYFGKSGQERALIGISRGLDSALVAAFAAMALGKDRVMGLYMPTRYSTEQGKIDAEALAINLGIRFEIVPIDDTLTHMIELLQTQFSTVPDGIVEENLQARIRGMVLMAFANQYASLVLSTGNKSEFAMGYCTLYGDMVGAISPIGDVLKTDCYELARRLNRDKEIIPDSILE